MPVYEEVQLQNIPNIRVKLSERNLSSNADASNSSTSINQTNLKSKCIALVVVLSLLAIAMVIAITLSAYALVSSNQGMDSLMRENQELKIQLNKTKEHDFTRIETDGLNTLTTTNNATMALLNSLQFSVSTLEGVLSGLGPGQVSEAINAISNLQSSVSSLTTRINSPVNLYQSCIQETRSCTGASRTGYLNDCITPYLPVNKSVSCKVAIML